MVQDKRMKVWAFVFDGDQRVPGKEQCSWQTIPYCILRFPQPTPGAVGTFYSDVFGWKIETNPEHNYVTFQSEGGFRGGFVGPSEPTYKSDRLLVYLPTDDIDATLAIIEARGGKTVHPKTEIPHVGWWAVFTDPAGNHLGLFNQHATES